MRCGAAKGLRGRYALDSFGLLEIQDNRSELQQVELSPVRQLGQTQLGQSERLQQFAKLSRIVGAWVR